MQRYESLKTIQQLSQEAALEIVKAGRTDKLSSLESQRKELTETIDVKVMLLSDPFDMHRAKG